MKLNTLKIFFLASLIATTTTIKAEIETPEQNINNEGVGFGIGAIIGGLIAGPPGAVIGAAGGSLIGHNKTLQEQATDPELYAALEKELQDKNDKLLELENKLSRQQVEHLAELSKLNLENNHQFTKLKNGISLSVYFRTNDSNIDKTMLPHINKLATFIKNYPELKIRLLAYADHRGKTEFNLSLSESRAQRIRDALVQSGVPAKRIEYCAYGESKATANDEESLVFDRRVDIQLTIDAKV